MSGLWTVCVEQLFRLLTCCTKKKNLCCEGEWKVCVCLLNKTSTVEQHILSTEANWFLQNYSLILPVCHKKTGFAYFPFNTAEVKVFLHWPVYNYSVVMRLDLKKKKKNNPPVLVLYLFGFYLIQFFEVCKWSITTLLEPACKSNRTIVQYHGFLRETLTAVV